MDGDNAIDAAVEIKEENHYYPFGLKHKGYNGNQIGRDHNYGFGGKEEQSELGLEWQDFGARNYDASLGRWMNIDPLADKWNEFSPYNYTLNNPVYFVDPDGRDVYISRIKGMGDEEYEAFKSKTFADLQRLTNDELSLDKEGKVTIVGCDGGDVCSAGTNLLSELINHDKVTTIVKSTKTGRNKGKNGTDFDNRNNANIREDGSANVGSNAIIFYDPFNDTSKALDENGNTDRPAFIALAHELGHAVKGVNGKRDQTFRQQFPRVVDPDNKGVNGLLNEDEYESRINENLIRAEHNIPLRVTNHLKKDIWARWLKL